MNKTALVVDDSKSARFALRKFLEGFNYKVETAESANDAYRILGGTLPEVIFMDHIMPGTDGFEALRVLKTDPRTAEVPVVICSSNEGEDFIAQARARGASNVLQKPPSPEQLAGVLANLTSHTPSYPSAMPPQMEENPLAMTLAPTLMPRREPTAMERLMATIPPKMIPTAHLLATSLMPSPPGGVTQGGPSTLPNTTSSTLPMPSVSIPPPPAYPKVQSLREPAVTIQQAVMKSIRDSMPQEQTHATATMAGLPSMPALTTSGDAATALVVLREEIDDRLGRLRHEVMSELGALRNQLTDFNSGAFDEKLRAVATEAAKARTNALASSLEQHLSALRSNLDAVLRAQNERIEQLLQNSRQVAAEEAERTVMKAAQRISDQMAESILKTLGPQLSSMRRL
ncbi:MAG: response regulator [Stagnimonas sp.]|nr:response regulator [Stagnimonas sp.]